MMAGYITGKPIQVVVKNIPEKWNLHKVKNFLELCCDAGEEDDVLPISYFNDVRTIAKSGFNNNVDLEKVILNAKAIKPRIELLELSDPVGLILYNLPPDVTVDTVCRILISFDDGLPGDTLTIKLYKEINIAVLLVDNIEVVEKWLQEKLCGKVTMEPYHQSFHGEVIRRLLNDKLTQDIVPQKPKITIIKKYHVDYDNDEGVEDSISIDQFPETYSHNTRYSIPTCTSQTSVPDTCRYNRLLSKPRRSMFFDQASFIVKHGDITKEKADVLVNVLSPDMNLRHTAVGQSFIKAGGPSFVKNFEAEKATQGFSSAPQNSVNPGIPPVFMKSPRSSASAGAIIETDGTILGCQRVCHILLEKWRGSQSAQVLTAVIEDVLNRAHGHQLTSVAFPSLGCGKLYGFPPDMMATITLTALKQSVYKYPSIKKITFVIYDKDVYEVFLSKMSPVKASSPHTAMASPVTSDSETDECSDSDDDFSNFTMESVREDKEIPGSSEAYIQLFAATKDVCENAKKKLIKYLQDTYLHKDSVKNNTIIHLNRYIRKDIIQQAEKLNVSVHLPDIKTKDVKMTTTPEIKLQGEIPAVDKVKIKIQDILLKEVQKSHKYYDRSQESGVPSKGTMEYLQHMAIKPEREPPSYWKKSKKWKVPDFLSLKKPKESLKSTSSLYICIEDLVQKTWRADRVGHGKDAFNLHHQNIKITSIERIENLELYHKYCDRRCELFGKAVKLQMSFINIDKIPGSSGPILTTKLAGPELKQDIYPEVNEHYVFHGSMPEKLEAICSHGLDNRTSSNDGLFGSAVYTAESSTKADQYADDKQKRLPGPKKMILSRILLGSVYLCTDRNAPKYKKPPCTDLTHLDPVCTQGHEFFDSIMGDKSWLFREFAIYDDRSTYPEYVITYNRC